VQSAKRSCENCGFAILSVVSAVGNGRATRSEQPRRQKEQQWPRSLSFTYRATSGGTRNGSLRKAVGRSSSSVCRRENLLDREGFISGEDRQFSRVSRNHLAHPWRNSLRLCPRPWQPIVESLQLRHFSVDGVFDQQTLAHLLEDSVELVGGE